MSRTRVRAEDLFCARCRRPVKIGAAHWPEGYLCAACRDHALETYGQCIGCGVDRLTPGLAPDGGRWCTDCAGGLGDFFCERCGREAARYQRGVCGNCVLAERLDEFLDDGTGRIRGELVPFYDEVRNVVLQAPPSVVAGMLGYHAVHTEAVAAQAGGTWKKYAPGDHARGPHAPSNL